jgi:hypothetical protein
MLEHISQDQISVSHNAVAPMNSAARGRSTGLKCLLDAQPTDLVPCPWLGESRKKALAQQLIVNPACHISSDNTIHMPFLDTSSDGGGMAWVLDGATGSVLPFWLGAEVYELLSRTQPGDPEPRGLSSELRAVLLSAQVIVESDYAGRRRREHARMVSRSAARFRKCGYVPLRGLIHPFHLGALRTHYRNMVRDGEMSLGDSQTARRYFAHNEPIACFFHHQLTALVAEIAGAPVKPSYVYVAAYQAGAKLPKHRDRAQCEYSISMCLDFSPEPTTKTPWPLCLETRAGAVRIFQRIGDALLYRGRELPHYRTRLAKDCTSTSVFFHYVHRDFDGPLT